MYGAKISVEIKEKRLSDNLVRDNYRRGEEKEEEKERDSTEISTFFFHVQYRTGMPLESRSHLSEPSRPARGR